MEASSACSLRSPSKSGGQENNSHALTPLPHHGRASPRERRGEGCCRMGRKNLQRGCSAASSAMPANSRTTDGGFRCAASPCGCWRGLPLIKPCSAPWYSHLIASAWRAAAAVSCAGVTWSSVGSPSTSPEALGAKIGGGPGHRVTARSRTPSAIRSGRERPSKAGADGKRLRGARHPRTSRRRKTPLLRGATPRAPALHPQARKRHAEARPAL
jgi:hypothetical protein